ncbi:hypothetical protein C8R47DRAFT_1217248 [Mycena vitilis]|nr:hypothetical protein C8R47DRAFT_1217248 [Mycena vitilis]
MTTSIQIRFEGLPFPYPAISWNLPRHPTFEPLPTEATLLIVPRSCLFINQHSDRRRQPITLNEAKKWGYDYDTATELLFARANTRTGKSRFCLRLILNAERFINSPNDERRRAFDRLVRDAEFHATHLVTSERYIVPVHYGIWLMDTGGWAGKVFFSITQWCGVSWHNLERTAMDNEANRILVARTFETLHDSGFQHGDITDPASFRHAILDLDAPGLSKADLLNGKARCYIVGFSKAQAKHRCNRKLPILPISSTLPFSQAGCEEAADVLLYLNFTKNVKSGTSSWSIFVVLSDQSAEVSASVALNWHRRYRELHPDQSNMAVSMVQRARLYGSMPQVYPGCFDIVFEDESDVYSRAAVLPIEKEDLDEEAHDGDETEPVLERVPTYRSDSTSPERELDVAEPVTRKLALVSLDDTRFASKV